MRAHGVQSTSLGSRRRCGSLPPSHERIRQRNTSITPRPCGSDISRDGTGEELELELEGNANCISSWSWYAGELDFQRNRELGLAQELVREYEELELELQRNAACISIWIWCASEEIVELGLPIVFRAGASMLA